MTYKEKKSKIADILMDFQEEYSNDVINRPMLASLYAGNILSFIDSMQKEPVSNPIDFEKELYKTFGQVKDFTLGMRIAKRFYDMGKKSREPVSEDLKKAAGNYAFTMSDEDEVLKHDAFICGAQWQKETLWKPADGNKLPEIDREIIALLDNGKVVFAHRPNPDGWDGKSLTSGKVEHYTPKTYDKGGWNIPNVKYWLDCSMPKEIEL